MMSLIKPIIENRKIDYMHKILNLRNLIFFIVTWSLIACKTTSKPSSTLYENGFVFNGIDFEKKNFRVIDGKFSFKEDTRAKNKIDLEGKYVIPPFGDAHTHNFDDVTQFDSLYKAYINEGTFYIQVLTNHYSSYLQVKDKINTPGKIDVAFRRASTCSL